MPANAEQRRASPTLLLLVCLLGSDVAVAETSVLDADLQDRFAKQGDSVGGFADTCTSQSLSLLKAGQSDAAWFNDQLCPAANEAAIRLKGTVDLLFLRSLIADGPSCRRADDRVFFRLRDERVSMFVLSTSLNILRQEGIPNRRVAADAEKLRSLLKDALQLFDEAILRIDGRRRP